MRTLLLTAVLALSACAATPEPAVPAGEVVGEPIEAREVVALADAHADPAAHFDRTLLVRAEVVAVCQRKGCWMQLTDGDATALVRWEEGCGGQYAFPMDLAGREVVVQGSFYPKELEEADAEHMEEEAGEELHLERVGYELNVSAVILVAEEEAGRG
jgi:hypothetical protein